MINIPNVIIDSGDTRLLMSEYGLIIKSKKITAPRIQRHIVSVPGRNGSIDLSRYISVKPRFEDREITIVFEKMTINYKDLVSFMSMLETKLNTSYDIRLIFDEEPYFEYIGRITSLDYKWLKTGAEITLKATVAPHKYVLGSNRAFDTINPDLVKAGELEDYMRFSLTERKVFEIINNGPAIEMLPKVIRNYHDSQPIILESWDEDDEEIILEREIAPGESFIFGDNLNAGTSTVTVKPKEEGTNCYIDLVFNGGAI